MCKTEIVESQMAVDAIMAYHGVEEQKIKERKENKQNEPNGDFHSKYVRCVTRVGRETGII